MEMILKADYLIDYEHGTISLSDLENGTRIIDPSYEWEFRIGNNNSGSGVVMSVTWVVTSTTTVASTHI